MAITGSVGMCASAISTSVIACRPARACARAQTALSADHGYPGPGRGARGRGGGSRGGGRGCSRTGRLCCGGRRADSRPISRLRPQGFCPSGPIFRPRRNKKTQSHLIEAMSSSRRSRTRASGERRLLCFSAHNRSLPPPAMMRALALACALGTAASSNSSPAEHVRTPACDARTRKSPLRWLPPSARRVISPYPPLLLC